MIGDIVEVVEVWGGQGCQLHWGTMNTHDEFSTVSAIKNSGMTKYIVKHPESSIIDSPHTVRVTFHSTEGKSEVKSYTPGKPYGSLPTPSRSGCTFLGWYPEGIREGKQTARTTATEVPAYDHNLFAHWRAKVTFQPDNGTSNSSVNVDFGIGEGKLAITQAPSRTGYRFIGWRNQSTGVLYTVGESMPVTGNVTLNAEWKVIEHTITHVVGEDAKLYNRDGKLADKPTDKVGHESNYVAGYVAVRTGYKFAGWACGDKVYRPGQAIAHVTSDLTLTAQWEELTVCLNFDTDGHEPIPPKTLTYSQVVDKGGSMDLIPASLVPQPTDGIFAGWLIKNAKEPDGVMHADLPGFKNYDLKAAFSKKYFSVVYDANGGDYTPPFQTKESGKPIILSRAMPYKQKYDHFVGWSEDPNCSGEPEYLPGQVYNVNRDVTLYAVYRNNEFCVQYVLEDTEYDGPMNQTFNSADIAGYGGIKLSEETPKREGCCFDKWLASTADGIVYYYPGDLYTERANVRLHAVWNKEPEVYMTVSLHDPYNGSNLDGQYRVKQGAAYKWDYSNSDTNPVARTFTTEANKIDPFRGYFMGYADGNGRIIHGDEIVTLGEDHTLTAKWVGPAPFYDLDDYDYAKEAIAKCYRFGYISGETNYQYNPSGMIKRGDAALMLSRMIKMPAVGNNWFYDVPTSGSNYLQAISKAVTWTKDWNILSGTNSTLQQFSPDAPIIRQDLLVLLYRFVKSQGVKLQDDYDVDLSVYTDAAQVSSYALPAMKWALATKMTSGTSKETLSPKENVNRAEMALFMLRLRRMLIKEGLMEDIVH
ncbi:MAG: hypothetical protein HFE77_00720 [Clostridiales bacterium]|nr:hypothetical protein [Clostridiales bacterium]